MTPLTESRDTPFLDAPPSPPLNYNGNGSGGNEPLKPHKYPVHPLQVITWLFIAAVVMLFAAFTSYYIVKMADTKNWAAFRLPKLFWANTCAIVISSGTLHWGWLSLKRGRLKNLQRALVLTALFGILFLVGQILAWQILYNENIILNGNASYSILYLLTGTHILHLTAGLAVLFVVLIRSFRNHYSPENSLGLILCAQYWHFLTLLWVYLFIFLLVNRG